MTFRRRLIPVAALVVAIGASAAGAATAAEAGGSGKTGGDGAGSKPVACKVVLKGDTFKKGGKTDAAATAKAKAEAEAQKATAVAGKGQTKPKGGTRPPADKCVKKEAVISLDTIAAKLGVSKTALVQALTQTKQWVAASGAKPSVAQYEQHLADLLHVPVAKVAAVLDIDSRAALKGAA